MKAQLFLFLFVAFIALSIVGRVASSMNTLGDKWAFYYHGQDPTSATVWVGIRNQSKNLQSLDLGDLDFEIKDANGYEYALSYRYDVPWRSLPQTTDSNLSEVGFDYPRNYVIPPGASFLIPFRHNIPANAPSPKIRLSKGFLGIGARRVPLNAPEAGFRPAVPNLDYSSRVYKKGDVTVELGRAWWWDECVIVLELRVNNRGGGNFGSGTVGDFALWGSQFADGRGTRPRTCPSTGVSPYQMFSPTNQWWIPGYTEKTIYHFFVPHLDDAGRDNFTLAAYNIEGQLDLPLMSPFWYTLEETHVTSLPVLASPPSDAPAVPVND